MQAEKNQIFNTLKQLASLMTNMFGDNCEVVIHDLTTKKMQLVHITGKVTKRTIGVPVTDVVKKISPVRRQCSRRQALLHDPYG